MKVSVVIPSYNQGDYIEKTILSIYNQTYDNIEIIITDGGSNDQTVDVIKKHEDKIAYFVSEKDSGQTEAINKGFAKCTGDIVTWLCSDDLWEPGTIEKVVKAFQENPDVNLVCGNRRTYGLGIKDTIYEGWEACDTLEETICFGQYDQPPSFFRKEVWDTIFPLSENLRVFMDCEMWLRYVFTFGQDKVKYIPELFAHGLFHADSKSVNEAVPCRRVINAFYASMAKQFGLSDKINAAFDTLDKFDYKGTWDVKQDIDKEQLEKFMWKKFSPQFEDPSYLYRDVAGYFMYLGNARASMKNAMEGIKMKPFKLINYRTWFYAFRQSLK